MSTDNILNLVSVIKMYRQVNPHFSLREAIDAFKDDPDKYTNMIRSLKHTYPFLTDQEIIDVIIFARGIDYHAYSICNSIKYAREENLQVNISNGIIDPNNPMLNDTSEILGVI